MPAEIDSPHLWLDWNDRVWVCPSHGRPTPVGLLDDDPYWPMRFGTAEPPWFTEELAYLRAQLEDARWDYRGQVLGDFDRGIGAIR